MGYEGTEVQVQRGGTGVQSLTSKGVIIGQGTDPVQVTAALTDGQLLIGSTGNNPVPASLTSSNASINITQGAGTLDLTSSVSASGNFATNAVLKGVDGTGAIQDSGVLIDGSNACTGMTQLDVDNIRIDGNTISSTDADGFVNVTPDNTSGASTFNVSAARIFQDFAVNGNAVRCRMQNSDNTGAAQSDCHHSVQVGNATNGDPYYSAIESLTHAWSWGMDQSVNANYRLEYESGTSNPTFSSGTLVWTATTAGEITMPLQPCFQAYLGTSTGGVTGNGAGVILGDTDVMVALTEVKDQGGDFNNGSSSGAILTAPVTAQWIFRYSALFQTSVGSATSMDNVIATSNGNYRGAWGSIDPSGIDNGNSLGVGDVVMVDMDAADTATYSFNLNGVGANTVTIYGQATTDRRTNFAGWQLG